MKGITLLKILCYACIAGGLACKLFIKDPVLSSALGISLMALAVVVLGIVMYRSRRQ